MIFIVTWLASWAAYGEVSNFAPLCMVGGVGKKQKMTWQLRTIQGYVLILIYVRPERVVPYAL